jgi:transmembrane sensor
MKHSDKQERYEYLANQWKSKTISTEEEAELMNWLNTSSEQVKIPAEFAKSEADLSTQMYNNISRAIAVKKKPHSFRLWSRIAGAAAALFLIVGAAMFLYKNQFDSSLSYKNDIAPGSNIAVLTLANGKKIKLSGAKTGVIINAAELTYNDGSAIDSSSGVRGTDLLPAHALDMMIATPRGGTYQLTLPDGTRVWLNADSKLTFPAQFVGNSRIVTVTGEAYFEVAKNKARPFKVISKNQEIKVLGTHFNVSSYEDEMVTRTTLLEGKVNVSTGKTTGTLAADVILQPNQQADLINGVIKVEEVNAEKAIAWKNGKFEFVSEDIESILRKIARWYNVEIVYKDELVNKQFSGSFSKFDNVAKVLQTIELTNTIHFKIEGRRILVTK